MTQQEFETRTALTVNSAEFDYIHRVYMASNLQKDDFCKEWKEDKKLATSNLVCDLTMEIEMQRDTIESQGKQIKKSEDALQAFTDQMVDFLILQAEKWSASDLRDKAIKLVGIKEYIRRRLDMTLGLWEEDRKALLEILK